MDTSASRVFTTLLNAPRIRGRKIRTITITVIALFSLSSLLGCPKKPNQFDSLVNQGLMPVSAENPFVGPNLFLGREMERSAYLLNFLRSKGSPQAIELHGDDLESAELKLFYPSKREVYVASQTLDKKQNVKEWIIRGPYAIGREYYKEVSKLPPTDRGVFEVYGTREYFGGPAIPHRSVELKPVFVPTPKPTPRPVIKRRATPTPSNTTPTPPPVPSPMNFDQRALLEAQQKANAPTSPTTPALIIVTSAPNATTAPTSSTDSSQGSGTKAVSSEPARASKSESHTGSPHEKSAHSTEGEKGHHEKEESKTDATHHDSQTKGGH